MIPWVKMPKFLGRCSFYYVQLLYFNGIYALFTVKLCYCCSLPRANPQEIFCDENDLWNSFTSNMWFACLRILVFEQVDLVCVCLLWTLSYQCTNPTLSGTCYWLRVPDRPHYRLVGSPLWWWSESWYAHSYLNTSLMKIQLRFKFPSIFLTGPWQSTYLPLEVHINLEVLHFYTCN